MIVVSVTYPAAAGKRFDVEYYIGTHMPLVRQRWSGMGLQEARLLRGSHAPDGGAAPFFMTALLTFDSVEAFKAAGAAHGREIFGDIPNFTDTTPVVQVNEPLD